MESSGPERERRIMVVANALDFLESMFSTTNSKVTDTYEEPSDPEIQINTESVNDR